MKKTATKSIFPLSLGLHKTFVPGTQDPRSLIKAKNISLRTKPSIKKMPGIRRIPHTGGNDGVQGAIQFFCTVGNSQIDEIIRVRKGRLEVIRNENIIDLGISVSESDTPTFERFENVLIIHFENSRPVYYTAGGTSVTNLSIIASHVLTPPRFSRGHDYRLFYSGRNADPHKIWASAVNSITNYTLLAGGFSMRVRNGDGDPVGITGISPPFRGDIYAFKWNSIHRIYRSNYGYGIDTLTDENGAIHHNAIVSTQNDIYYVSPFGIHSLTMTDKYGAAEGATITYPIYDYFQKSINWSNAKNMILKYDKASNTLLLSYSSSGSMTNDRVLGYNILTKQFFEWHYELPVLGNYFDFGIQKTLVHSSDVGTGYLDEDSHLIGEQGIDMEIETGPIFPLENPKGRVIFTNGWLIAKPTSKNILINIFVSIDGKQEISTEVDTFGDGEGAVINPDTGGIIGTDLIGWNREDMAILPFKCEGEGASVKFRITQEPPENDPDQECELFGILFEFESIEDSNKKETL